MRRWPDCSLRGRAGEMLPQLMLMKICYFDAFSGITGDMTVGALVDAGADVRSPHRRALDSLATGATFRIEKRKRSGIAATKFHVEAARTRTSTATCPTSCKMIEAAALCRTGVKQNAIRVFRRLGEAEAAGPRRRRSRRSTSTKSARWIPSADIVGACLGFELLGVEQIYCSPVNIGSGTVGPITA